MYFIINIYSDNYQDALKYLKNTEINLNNVLIITGDFNIRDNNWDLFYPHHLSYIDSLFKIANSLGLDLSIPINSSSTWFLDNFQDLESLLDLIFLRTGPKEFNNYLISLNLQSSLDYVSLLVFIIMKEKFIKKK